MTTTDSPLTLAALNRASTAEQRCRELEEMNAAFSSQVLRLQNANKQTEELWNGAEEDFEKVKALIAPFFTDDPKATRWDNIVESVTKLVTRLESSEDKLINARDYLTLISSQIRKAWMRGRELRGASNIVRGLIGYAADTCTEALEKTK